MKKIIYFAAALAVFAGCAKNEVIPQNEGENNIAVSLSVDEDATKAVYDGTGLVKFEKSDAFYAAVAKKETPTKGIKVAKQKGGLASVYYSKFTIADPAATSPVFNGNLYSIVEDDFADEYILYGLFPTSAISSVNIEDEDNLTKWYVSLNYKQTATQTAWESKSDVMVLKPVVISTSNNSFDDKYKEYTTTQNEKVKFAHVFGFGKINFAGVPAKYADLVVESVKIEATGENQNMTGSFYIDMTKNIEEIVPTPESTARVYNYVELAGDNKTTVKDYVAWFVANPGVYDVKITVETAKAALVFERQGLEIVRSEIAAPTVNFKEADVVTPHDLELVDGENWAQKSFSYYTSISSSYKVREWGDGSKKMKFTLSYPDEKNSNYGSNMDDVQILANSNLTGGKIVLSSLNSFIGVKNVKANFGVYTDGVVADFTVNLVGETSTTKLGVIALTGNSKSVAGQDVWFDVPDGCDGKGELQIVVDNFRVTAENPANDPLSCRPYLGTLEVNAAPGIVVDKTQVNVEKTAAKYSLNCEVKGTANLPAVKVSDDAQTWLSASYENGVITLDVAENTGVKRTGTVTVSVTGLVETVETITVVQASATAKEYKLTITAKDMYPFITAAKKALEDGGTTVDSYDSFPVEATFTAAATDGSDAKKTVTFNAEKIVLASATESKFSLKKNFTSSALGEISKVVIEANKKIGATNYTDDLELKFSANGTDWAKAKTADGFSVQSVSRETSGYTSTVTGIPETYNMIRFYSEYYSIETYSIEITFVAD